MIETYQPKSLKEIIGSKAALQSIKYFLSSYKTRYKDRKKALFIYGQTGTGKTAMVIAAAEEFGFELFLINWEANEETISKISAATRQKSLFGKPKLLLIEDFEESEKNYAKLQCIIDNTAFPIIITTTTSNEQIISQSKLKNCIYAKLEGPSYGELFALLKSIAEKEGIKHEDAALKNIARINAPDIRASIIDLITNKDNPKEYLNNTRDQSQEIKHILSLVFTIKDLENFNSWNIWNIDLEEYMHWLDENMPKEYSPLEIKKAYPYISKADRYLGRIKKTQEFSYIRYASVLLTSGIALSKSKNENTTTRQDINHCAQKGMQQYTRPSRFLKLYLHKRFNPYKAKTISLISKLTHSSLSKAAREYPYIKFIR